MESQCFEPGLLGAGYLVSGGFRSRREGSSLDRDRSGLGFPARVGGVRSKCSSLRSQERSRWVCEIGLGTLAREPVCARECPYGLFRTFFSFMSGLLRWVRCFLTTSTVRSLVAARKKSSTLRSNNLCVRSYPPLLIVALKPISTWRAPIAKRWPRWSQRDTARSNDCVAAGRDRPRLSPRGGSRVVRSRPGPAG